MLKLKKYIFNILKFSLRLLLVYLIYSVLIIFLLKWINPQVTAYIQQKSEGNFFPLFKLGEVNQKWISIDKISRKAVLAVIASEDQKFLDHSGFDVEQIKIAIENNQRGKRIRGASTITQQTAKNLFLWSDKSFIRKGLEAYYTILLEIIWGKRRIIEVYMNIAELGKNVYGFEAASTLYLKKNSSKLSMQESAVMAAVLPSPLKRSIKSPSRFVLLRAGGIIRKMQQLGGVSYLNPLFE